MANFPALVPADAIITPGAIPATVVEGYDGSTVTATADTVATGDTLTLPFQNLTEAEANGVRNHARDQQGRPFAFDAVTLAPALSLPGYAWVHAADPQQDDIRSVAGSELYFLTCSFRAVRVRVALVPTATSRIVLRTYSAKALPAGPPGATSTIRLTTTAAGVPTTPPAAKSLILLRTTAAGWLDTTIHDPYFDSILFLCGFSGAEGSTNFVDEGPLGLALTGVGNAQITTEWSAFGGSSLKLDQPSFDSPQSSVRLPLDRTILITGDYTLDVRCRFASLKNHCIFGRAGVQMGLDNAGNTIYHIYGGQGNTQAFEPLYGIAANTPVALRYARKLNPQQTSFTYYTFVNGTLVMARDSGAVEVLDITGANIGWAFSKGLNGNIDEIRLTNGICRSTTSYTVDNAPFLRQ